MEASLFWGVFENGDVAQLGEHRLCKAGVRGSSPLVSIEARFSGPLFLCANLSCLVFKANRPPVGAIANRLDEESPH